MKCPFCGDQESKVVDSRHSEDGLSIRRRRECMACQRRFTTYEIVESLPIIVVKRNGSRQSFDRNKILNSMIRAFDKRKVNVEDLDKITTEIEQAIQNSLEREISTDKLGEMILERLKPLDEVAYIRFASVYRRFQDVNSFMREISSLMDEFDPAALLPELDTIIGKIAFVVRIAVMAGPLLLLIMGLFYLFAAPKEANYHLGYRCYYGMGSVEAWQFTQRLAGIVFGALGLILSIVMMLISGSFEKMQTMDLLWRAVYCVLWQMGLVAAACLSINITAAVRFDKRGDLRRR